MHSRQQNTCQSNSPFTIPRKRAFSTPTPKHVFRYPPPPSRPKMPFTHAVNVYSDMSLSKWHLGSMGASKNKLKDTSFIFPMTNVTILCVFHTHAQKEYGKVWQMKSTPILNIFALLLF